MRHSRRLHLKARRKYLTLYDRRGPQATQSAVARISFVRLIVDHAYAVKGLHYVKAGTEGGFRNTKLGPPVNAARIKEKLHSYILNPDAIHIE